MDRNHWDDNNDRNQNDNNILISSSQRTKTERKGSRIGLIVAIGVLCAALCFGAGAIGSLMVHSMYDFTWAKGEDGLRPSGNEDAPTFETPTDDNPSFMSGEQDASSRNPLPNIEKNAPQEILTYAGSAGDEAYATLAEAYDAVADTVVEISTETVVNGGFFGDYVTGGAGSGVIISADGYIVTNHHVIDAADTVTVRLKSGKQYRATVMGKDQASDIAVLWVECEEVLPAAKLGCSSDLIVGEKVFAIGNPLGSLGGTLTDGIISATARAITIDGSPMTLLQTNAAVNPGNSGGGLFNMAGELVGVINAKYCEDDVEGLGFAIPIDTAYEVICELIEYGYVRGVADAGLTLYDVTNTMTAWKNFGSTRLGAYIVDSQYTEELQFGDYLVSVEGVTILQGADLETVLASCAVGDTVTIEVIRMRQTTKNGKTVLVEMPLSINLTLKEYVPADIDVRFDTE
jgi:serine protease Do